MERITMEADADDKACHGAPISGGNFTLPSEVVSQYSLRPGTMSQASRRSSVLRLHRPVEDLAKVYIEPTNRCNLDCRTCMRNDWDEELGLMSRETFRRIIDGIGPFPLRPTVFFGGLGEPLVHPDIVEMVTAAKTLGSSVELITNGTLLTGEMSKGLIDAGLDMLWVSLDGATPESYADVRLGATLHTVLTNLRTFQRFRLARNITGNCRSREGYAIYEKPHV